MVGSSLLQRWPTTLQLTVMASSVVTHNDGRQRYNSRWWPTALQLTAMASNVVTHGTVVTMAGNTLQLTALLRWWPATRCRGDGRHQTTTCDAAMMAGSTLEPWPTLRCNVFILFLVFFLLDSFKRKKEREKERSFETCSLASQLCWL
jgi:hypothetical protein